MPHFYTFSADVNLVAAMRDRIWSVLNSASPRPKGHVTGRAGSIAEQISTVQRTVVAYEEKVNALVMSDYEDEALGGVKALITRCVAKIDSRDSTVNAVVIASLALWEISVLDIEMQTLTLPENKESVSAVQNALSVLADELNRIYAEQWKRRWRPRGGQALRKWIHRSFKLHSMEFVWLTEEESDRLDGQATAIRDIYSGFHLVANTEGLIEYARRERERVLNDCAANAQEADARMAVGWGGTGEDRWTRGMLHSPQLGREHCCCRWPAEVGGPARGNIHGAQADRPRRRGICQSRAIQEVRQGGWESISFSITARRWVE